MRDVGIHRRSMQRNLLMGLMYFETSADTDKRSRQAARIYNS